MELIAGIIVLTGIWFLKANMNKVNFDQVSLPDTGTQVIENYPNTEPPKEPDQYIEVSHLVKPTEGVIVTEPVPDVVADKSIIKLESVGGETGQIGAMCSKSSHCSLTGESGGHKSNPRGKVACCDKKCKFRRQRKRKKFGTPKYHCPNKQYTEETDLEKIYLS